MGDKIIRDSIHGYIAVPETYMKKFIDTEPFQRLRSIEQTSMRCLYPCARHDRFTHSIGTFHLGRKLIGALKKNLSKFNIECYHAFSSDEWDTITNTFEIACLLHDCGHAPFSHTIEKYMDYPFDPTIGKAGLLVDLLSNATKYSDPVFADKRWLVDCTSNHEKASALLLWEKYKDDVRELRADPIWAMRMILGYHYTPANNIREEVLNCIFDLLNGTYIDVDKLDYIVRDTASSGVDNFSVDLQRFIDSVTIVRRSDKLLSIGYLKTSINVIQNIISAKNNLYLWIYAHHKVQYYSNLLCVCFEKAVAVIFGFDVEKEKEKINATCSKIVSVEAMIRMTEVSSAKYSEIFYLPCDSDIMGLIKKAYRLLPDDSDFIELLSRKYKKSVWKSHAEYTSLFDFKGKSIATIHGNVKSKSSEIIESICEVFPEDSILRKKDSWTLLQAQAKLSITKDSEIYILFDHDLQKEYSSFSYIQSEDLPAFFYLYNDGAPLGKEDKARVVEAIKRYSR